MHLKYTGRALGLFVMVLLSATLVTAIGYTINDIYGQGLLSSSNQPIINDPNLKAEVITKGLQNPTSMAFLGPNDILVLEKDQGTVQRKIKFHSNELAFTKRLSKGSNNYQKRNTIENNALTRLNNQGNFFKMERFCNMLLSTTIRKVDRKTIGQFLLN